MNNLLTFSIGVIATLVLSWLAFIVGARSQLGDLQPTAENEDLVGPGAELFPKKMSGMASQGAEEYVSLGCISCHTQQVRLVAHMDKKLKDDLRMKQVSPRTFNRKARDIERWVA